MTRKDFNVYDMTKWTCSAVLSDMLIFAATGFVALMDVSVFLWALAMLFMFRLIFDMRIDEW